MHSLAFGAAANKYFKFFSGIRKRFTHTQTTAITFLRFWGLRGFVHVKRKSIT